MVLQVTGVSKSYGATAVLSDVALKIEEGERLGLVGVNGAGKSTLLQIIAGELAADEGQVQVARDTRLGYLHQDSGLDSGNAIWDEMISVFTPLVETEKELRELERQMADPALDTSSARYAELTNRYMTQSEWFRDHGGYQVEAKTKTILGGMGFGDTPLDLPVGSLSGGQKTRLALARLLLSEPDLLMLDEPTNHLDFPTLTWLETYLCSYPGAIVIVSHDRYLLDRLITAIYEIERTRIHRYTGNYTRFVELKSKEREVQEKYYRQQQAQIEKTEDWIQRHIARATSASAAKSKRRALERLERIEKPDAELKRVHFRFEAEKPSHLEVLTVKDLAVSVGEGESRRKLLEHVDFQVLRGEKVALIGANGIGKSTLLKTLMGRHPADSGSATWGGNVSLGYYDQEQCQLNPDHTVLEEVWRLFPRVEETRVRGVLGCFLFTGDDVFKLAGELSGGERARVALARLMLQRANVLVLDEPTNHLDLFSKEVLEGALTGYKGTLLFVSHSRYFLNKIAHRIMELTPTGVRVYHGNYEYYAAKKAEGGPADLEPRVRPIPTQTTAEPPSEYQLARQAQRDERYRQRRVAELEQRITQLEAGISLIEGSLADPAVANNYVLLQQRWAAIESRKGELQECYDEWEELLA